VVGQNVVGWSSYLISGIDEGLANYLALLFDDSQKIPQHKKRGYGWIATENAWWKKTRRTLCLGDRQPGMLGFRLDSRARQKDSIDP